LALLCTVERVRVGGGLLAHAGLQTAAELQKIDFSLAPFFRRASIEINGSRIEDIADAQIVSSLRMLTENTRAYNETVLSQGYSVATSSTARKLAKQPGQVVFIPLQQIFASVKHIPLLYGCKIRLEFSKNPFVDMVAAYTNPDAQSPVSDIWLSDIRLRVPVYIPTDLMKTEIESKLAGEKAFEREFAFELAWLRAGNPVTAPNPQESMAIATGTPVRVYLAPVPTAADGTAGNRTAYLPGTAGSYFQRVNILLDNRRVLESDLLNMNRDDCAEFYMQYLDHLRKQNYSLGAPLSYDDFRATYQIICFDIQHQDQSLFSSGRSHDLALDITSNHGATPATANYRIYTVVILRAKAKLVGANSMVYIVK